MFAGVPPAGLQPPTSVAADRKPGGKRTFHLSCIVFYINPGGKETFHSSCIVFLHPHEKETCLSVNFLFLSKFSFHFFSIKVKKLTKFFGDEPPLLRLYLKVNQSLVFDLKSIFCRTLATRNTRGSLRRQRLECLSCPTFPRKGWRSSAFPWDPG